MASPRVEAAAAGPRSWEALGTTSCCASATRAMLRTARSDRRAELAAIDRACSRFRPDSELSP